MNRYLHFLVFVCCILSILFLAACDNDDELATPAVVLSPRANQSFSIDYQYSELGIVTASIRFSKPMDPGTIAVGQTLFLEGLKKEGAMNTWRAIGHTASWSADFTILTLTALEESGTWCTFSPDCFFRLRLIGTDEGQGAIRDTDGLPLNGDNDRLPGGNFETTFGIVG
jgi:hypothetical protein